MGILLGLVCGAVTSGLGYVLWYTAVKEMTAARAAIIQLPAPVLAGAGGVLFLGEAISRRLVLAAIAVLGGIALALIGREQSRVCVSIDTDHVRPHDGVRGGESS